MSGMEASSLMGEEMSERRPLSWSAARVATVTAVGVAAAVATAAAATMTTLRIMLPGDVHSLQNKEGMMVVKPAYEDCAHKASDNCLIPRCCGASGYNCFEVASGKGRCMRECTPGGANGSCIGVAPHMRPIAESPGLSLFCWAVYTENTGSTKPSSELALLQGQYSRMSGIFSCAEHVVYSDVVAPLGGDEMTVQVHDVKGDWHLMKRKTVGTWVNTGMFVQVWSAIRDAGHYKNHNWIVKADADAVFFPHKLIKVLKPVTVPKEGLYLENCKYVDWGYFGNLEVFSKQAFATMVDNVEDCYTKLPWKIGVHNGKYGPMGEDLFAQKCMDLMKVAKKEMFELTTDGACEADRPEGQKKNKKFMPYCSGTSTPSIHPFKKPAAYFKCMDEAADAQP